MKHTALPPHDRLSRIMSNVKALVEDAAFKSQLEPWGLQIKPQMIKCVGHGLARDRDPVPPFSNSLRDRVTAHG